MKDKKIIFVCGNYGNGGAATVMRLLSEELVNKFEVEIVEFSDYIYNYEIPKNVTFHVLDKKNSKVNLITKFKRFIKLRKIIRENKKKDVTIIAFEYFVNLQVILANMFFKNTLIISERNDPANVGNNLKAIRNFLYRFADKLICQTYDAKEYFPNYIQKKTTVIPNPVMKNLPERFEGRRNDNIVTFCRFSKQKNLFMMIDAFKLILDIYPNYKLIIYGDGEEKNNIIEYIKKINLNGKVIIKPFTLNLHENIVDSAMYVSTSDFEGISNAMLESMAMGLPCVCTDCPCGGAKMIIKNYENGILSPVGDSNTFAQNCLKVLGNKELADKLSMNATKVREDFSIEKIIQKWIQEIK